MNPEHPRKFDETVSENELIAQFIGQHITLPGLRREVMIKSYYMDELKYNTSWDWLMPVIEKIGKAELAGGRYGKFVDFTISPTESSGWIFWRIDTPGDQNQPQSYPTEGTLIERVYKAVVEFIKWYNEQKP